MHLSSDMNGMQFLVELRRFDQIFPFFFYTLEDSAKLISSAFQAGANDYFLADGSLNQLEGITEAVRVSVEIASLLRDQTKGQRRSLFEQKYEGLFDVIIKVVYRPTHFTLGERVAYRELSMFTTFLDCL